MPSTLSRLLAFLTKLLRPQKTPPILRPAVALFINRSTEDHGRAA